MKIKNLNQYTSAPSSPLVSPRKKFLDTLAMKFYSSCMFGQAVLNYSSGQVQLCKFDTVHIQYGMIDLPIPGPRGLIQMFGKHV